MNHYLFISDAAKEVNVESHVLRYWEEELHLPIKRNELGHRYYTQDDVERFKQIKGMKERGLQLKAIRMILRDGKLDMLPEGAVRSDVDMVETEMLQTQWREAKECEESPNMGMGIEIISERPKENGLGQAASGAVSADFKEDKARRLQWLLQEMIRQTIQETNQELCREIRDSVVKELDYQFRMQEERDEAREKRLAERDEAYYKRMDELLRKKSRKGKIVETKKQDIGVEDVLPLEEQLKREVESMMIEKEESAGASTRGRERNAETVEKAIREKHLKHKKRHFF